MNLDVDFFTIENNGVAPKQGRILISEPFSQDQFFRRAIVLLTEHNADGSVGFILNKPVDIELNELINDIPYFDAKVSIGGPVNTDRIYYIHTLGAKIPNSVKVINNIYWGGDFSTLKQLIKASVIKPEQVRFFVGYTGWSKEQLNNEITKNFWLVSDIETDNIMISDKDIWEIKLNQMDKKYKPWANFPENPVFN